MDDQALIRPAVPTDADILVALAREAYSVYISRIGREPAPMTADYVAAIATGSVWVAEDRARLYTNEAMTENLAFYQRQGYIETHRGVQDGYHRVFLVKAVPRQVTQVSE